MKVLKNEPIALCDVVDGFVKSLVTPLCGAVSSNNFGEVIWKSKLRRLRKKFAGKARAPELSATTPEK